ncbi:MAG: PAS domain S-box protein [Gemmatimonadaceae bacterium]|nr:PAS domain S-box protein [Gemmatimonadaceae bacterium]
MTTPDAGAAERRSEAQHPPGRATSAAVETAGPALAAAGGAAAQRHLLLRYLVGTALGVLAIAAVKVYGPQSPQSVYFVGNCAVVVGIFVAGGFGPAAITIVSAYAATSYFLLAPRESLAISDLADVMRFTIGLALSLGAAGIEGRMRRERQRLVQREREVRESEWRYRVLVTEASDAILVFGSDGRCTLANARASELLGWSPDAMIGVACTELLRPVAPPGGTSVPPCLLREARHSSTGVLAERELVRTDGSTFVGELSARAFPDGTSQLILRDVTARRRAVDAMEAERDLLDGILATSSSGIIALDAATSRPVFVSQRLVEIIGLPREQLMQAASGEVPWVTRDAEGRVIGPAERPLARVLRSGRPVLDVPLTIELPGGQARRIRVSAAPLRDEAGRVSTVVQTVTDETERVRTERALQASEEQLRHIAQAFPGAVYQFSLSPSGEMRFTYVSEGVRELLGVAPEDAVGDFKNVWEAIAPEQRDLVIQSTMQSASTNEPWRLDIRIRHRDGKVRWVRGTGYPETERPEGVIRWNGIFLDVTDLKELESNLLQAQKMESVGRLAGGIAHDFNNILTAIRGNVDLLLETLAHGDERVEEVTEIRDAAERASTLTRQLLAFSRKQFLQPRELDLNSLVRDVEKMLRRVIGEDIALLTVPGDALGLVRADPGQVQQALLNLVVNARDAMPEGGLLTIDTRNVRLTSTEGAAMGLSPGEYVSLVVRDTGTGMTAEVRSRIFEPFFTTKPQGKGTGLGLATVYGIVQQSGGTITVESEPGRGSTFRLFFPRVAATRDAVSSPSGGTAIVAPTAGGAAQVILLVEDDPSVRHLVTRVLERTGYAVRAARDAYEALTLMDATCSGIDLVVSDVVMPGMGGRELAQELRRRRADVRILFISGYLDIDSSRLALDRRTRLLHKPFSTEALLDAVQSMLAGEGLA